MRGPSLEASSRREIGSVDEKEEMKEVSDGDLGEMIPLKSSFS